MKKVLLGALVIAAATTMTSCKKSYTCDCDVNGTTSTTTYDKIGKTQAATAKTACQLSTYCTWNQK